MILSDSHAVGAGGEGDNYTRPVGSSLGGHFTRYAVGYDPTILIVRE